MAYHQPLTPSQLTAYQTALSYHQLHSYYAAHDVLEEVLWRPEPHRLRQLLWQTCLQATVAAHHAQQGNVTGGDRLLAKATAKAEGLNLLARGVLRQQQPFVWCNNRVNLALWCL